MNDDCEKHQFGFKAHHSTGLCILKCLSKQLITVVIEEDMFLHVLLTIPRLLTV